MAKDSTIALVHGRIRRLMEEHPFLSVIPGTEPVAPYTLIDAALELFDTLDPSDIGRIMCDTYGNVVLNSVTELASGAQQGAVVSVQQLTRATFVDICLSVIYGVDGTLKRENKYRMQVAAELSAAAEQDAIAPA